MQNVKEKVMEYFRKYWGINRFMKSVSMVVLICFVWNIIGPNLAYAQQAVIEDKDLRKHQQDNVNVGAMRVNEATGTEGFTKDEENVIKRNGKLWGIWDEERQMALQATPDGFKANKTITKVIKEQAAEGKEEQKVLTKSELFIEGGRESEADEFNEESDKEEIRGEEGGKESVVLDGTTGKRLEADTAREDKLVLEERREGGLSEAESGLSSFFYDPAVVGTVNAYYDDAGNIIEDIIGYRAQNPESKIYAKISAEGVNMMDGSGFKAADGEEIMIEISSLSNEEISALSETGRGLFMGDVNKSADGQYIMSINKNYNIEVEGNSYRGFVTGEDLEAAEREVNMQSQAALNGESKYEWMNKNTTDNRGIFGLSNSGEFLSDWKKGWVALAGLSEEEEKSGSDSQGQGKFIIEGAEQGGFSDDQIEGKERNFLQIFKYKEGALVSVRNADFSVTILDNGRQRATFSYNEDGSYTLTSFSLYAGDEAVIEGAGGLKSFLLAAGFSESQLQYTDYTYEDDGSISEERRDVSWFDKARETLASGGSISIGASGSGGATLTVVNSAGKPKEVYGAAGADDGGPSLLSRYKYNDVGSLSSVTSYSFSADIAGLTDEQKLMLKIKGFDLATSDEEELRKMQAYIEKEKSKSVKEENDWSDVEISYGSSLSGVSEEQKQELREAGFDVEGKDKVALTELKEEVERRKVTEESWMGAEIEIYADVKGMSVEQAAELESEGVMLVSQRDEELKYRVSEAEAIGVLEGAIEERQKEDEGIWSKVSDVSFERASETTHFDLFGCQSFSVNDKTGAIDTVYNYSDDGSLNNVISYGDDGGIKSVTHYVNNAASYITNEKGMVTASYTYGSGQTLQYVTSYSNGAEVGKTIFLLGKQVMTVDSTGSKDETLSQEKLFSDNMSFEELLEKGREIFGESLENVLKIADFITEETGLSKEEVLEGFAKAQEEYTSLGAAVDGVKDVTGFTAIVNALASFLEAGGSIINCAADALGNIIEGTNKGVLAFTALIMDISLGTFSIEEEQIMTSAAAIEGVLRGKGVDADGYSMALSEIMVSMNDGDKSVLWVNGDHYITVEKKGEEYLVSDANKNEGRALRFSEEEFKKMLEGKVAQSKEGENLEYEKVADEEGKIKIITGSEGIRGSAKEGDKLSQEEMEGIKGAKYVTQTVSVQVPVTKVRTETRVGVMEVTTTASVASVDADGNAILDVEGNAVYNDVSQTQSVEYTYTVAVQYVEMVTETKTELVWVDDENDTDGEREAEAKRKEAEEALRKAELEALEAKIARVNIEVEIESKKNAQLAVKEALNKNITSGDYTAKDLPNKDTSIHIMSKEEKAAYEKSDEKIVEFKEDVAAQKAQAETEEQAAKSAAAAAQQALKEAVIGVFEAAQAQLMNAKTDAQKAAAQKALNTARSVCDEQLKDAILVDQTNKTVIYFDAKGTQTTIELKKALSQEEIETIRAGLPQEQQNSQKALFDAIAENEKGEAYDSALVAKIATAMGLSQEEVINPLEKEVDGRKNK